MKKHLLVMLIIFLSTIFLVVGCGNDDSKEPANESPAGETEDSDEQNDTSFKGEYIVDVNYLKENYNRDDVIVIDARGEDAAKDGTVEGATAFVWQSLANVAEGKPGDEMWGTIHRPEVLGETLGSLGIAMDKEIIIFGGTGNGWGDEGRILWTLVAAGYENVKMVDANFDTIAKEGIPTTNGTTALTPTNVTISNIDTSHIINTDELKANYENYKIIDVRAKDEYDGATKYGEAKGGHLPSAIHIPFTEFFNDDLTLKSNEELEKLFEDAGLSKTDTVVAYCTAGIRSAYAQLILEMLGYENSKNYDESFYRWAAVEEVE